MSISVTQTVTSSGLLNPVVQALVYRKIQRESAVRRDSNDLLILYVGYRGVVKNMAAQEDANIRRIACV
jgi:hypothetical protein